MPGPFRTIWPQWRDGHGSRVLPRKPPGEPLCGRGLRASGEKRQSGRIAAIREQRAHGKGGCRRRPNGQQPPGARSKKLKLTRFGHCSGPLRPTTRQRLHMSPQRTPPTNWVTPLLQRGTATPQPKRARPRPTTAAQPKKRKMRIDEGPADRGVAVGKIEDRLSHGRRETPVPKDAQASPSRTSGVPYPRLGGRRRGRSRCSERNESGTG
jgi:hypothetical protein